jgi:hypothetical protein
MEDYSILDEAKTIIDQRDFDKPDFINVADADWAAANYETRSLLIQLKRFEWHLGNAYSEAIKLRDWERASLLYEVLLIRPCLLSINPELYAEQECRKREAEFIARAREWVAEVKGLWPSIQGDWTPYYEKGEDRTA